MPELLPIAHVSHWAWVLYLPPVLIVLGSIARTVLAEKRESKSHSSAERTRGLSGGS